MFTTVDQEGHKMEKIIAEHQLIKVLKSNINKMFEDARDEEIFDRSDLWIKFSNRIHDIERAYFELTSNLWETQNVDNKCRGRIENCKLKLEIAEQDMLKEVPECAKLVGSYADVVPEPFDACETKLTWLLDYLTYLLGLNRAFGMRNLCWLYECRSDIKELQAYVQRLLSKEDLWTSIFQLKVCLYNFERDFDAAQLQLARKNDFAEIFEGRGWEFNH